MAVADPYEDLRVADLNQPSWILRPFWQWVTGTTLVVLIFLACAVPILLLQDEQTARSDGISAAAVKIECGISAFIDRMTTPLTNQAQDQASRDAANERGYAARRAFRQLQPVEYLSKCVLAPTPPAVTAAP